MSLARLQCLCGQTIGLGPPKLSPGKPQTFTAKCPCGYNWRLVLSQRNPAYSATRKTGDPDHASAP